MSVTLDIFTGQLQFVAAGGGGETVTTYPTFADFPATAANGTLALALDTDVLYVYNTGSASWVIIGGPGAALSVGTIDSGTASVNGAHIDSDQLIMQSASATRPGLVNNTTQTFAGQKTFSTGLTGTLTGSASLNVLTSALGNLTDTGIDGITVTGGTGAVVGTVSLSQHVADTTHNGYLSSTDWNTFNGKQSTTLTSAHLFVGNGSNVATDVAASGDLTLANTGAFTFNTVNSNVGSFTNASITVNGKGLITAASNGTAPVTSLSVSTANGFAGSSSGGTTPALTLTTTINSPILAGNGTAISAATTTGSGSTAVLATAPTLTNPVVGTQSQGDSSTKAASTSYVDVAVANAVAGINPAVAVQAATTAAGDTSGLTYNNGVSGIGATFTGSNNTAVVIDGFTFNTLGQRLLVKNDTQSPSGAFNGVYYVTQVQALALPPIFTRALDYDTPSDMNNTGAIPVINGTTNGTTSWVLTSLVVTVGTTPLTFTKFTRNPADYLLVANNLSDVASKSTSFNNLSPMITSGDIIYGGASGTGTRLGANATATNKYLQSVSSGIPSWAQVAFSDLSGSVAASQMPALTGDVTTTAGTVATSLVATTNGTLTNLSALTTATALVSVGTITTGTWSASTIALNKGGTGQTTKTAAFDALQPMTTGGDLIYGGASGTGTRLANGNSGQVLTSGGTTAAPTWQTPTTGTVTSVALSVPASSLFSVSGSPVTSSGTLAIATAGTSGGIPYFDTTSTLNSSAVLVTNGIVLGKGAGAAPATLATNASTAFPLVSGGTGTAPSWTGLTVAGGGTSVTSVTTSPTATAFAGWDANKNLSANSFIDGYTTTATAAGTTTLVVGSTQQQFFTGSTTQTVVLPVTSTLVLGQSYIITNNSTGVVTVQSSGANNILAQGAGTTAIYTVILTSGTGTSSWSFTYVGNGGAVTPTVQKFTTGTSQTYTTPANVIYIRVKMVGGGGGGSGSGTSTNTSNGGNGGNTTFGTSLLVANGGNGGSFDGGIATGGTASLGSGPIGSAITGGSASGAGFNGTSGGAELAGGMGGSTPFGGGGGGGFGAGSGGTGGAGPTNTGAGGGGAGTASTASSFAGVGGGAGGYVDAIIASPASTYTYSVGTAGTAGNAGNGTGAAAGGAGAAGYIEVTEYYSNGAVGTATNVTGIVAIANGGTGLSTPAYARYTSTAGTGTVANGATTIVNFATSESDSTSAVTTGASWHYTCASTGKFQVNASVMMQSAAMTVGNPDELYVYKNGSLYARIGFFQTWSSTTARAGMSGTTTVVANATDTIDIRYQNGAAGTKTLTATTGDNWVSIYQLPVT